jgi:2'-5' RNA ligase
MALPFAVQVRAPAHARGAATERLFVALWPDAGTRAHLAQAAGSSPPGRRIPAANLHLTLVFLGQVEAARRAVAASIMRAAAGKAFELVLDTRGHFAASRVLWLGSATPPAQLLALQARLTQGMRGAGFKLERRAFKAHVTLVRDCDRPHLAGSAAPLAWPARELALVRSQPARGGSRYEVIESVHLA